MSIRVRKIVCHRLPTADLLYIRTTLPCGVVPQPSGCAVMQLRLDAGTAEQFCTENLPDTPLEIVQR